MAYNYDEIFSAVDGFICQNPKVSLNWLSKLLQLSHPTIEKAIFAKTSLGFREYQQKKLFDQVMYRAGKGQTEKRISLEIGYKWPEHLSRFIKRYTGSTFTQLKKPANKH
jgi:AraC-like DNA-binding protein